MTPKIHTSVPLLCVAAMLMLAPLRPVSSLLISPAQLSPYRRCLSTLARGNRQDVPFYNSLRVPPMSQSQASMNRSFPRFFSTSLDRHNNADDNLWYSPSLMDHMLYRIQAVNNVPDTVQQSLINFTVDGKVLGKVGDILFECSKITIHPFLVLIVLNFFSPLSLQVTPKVAQRLCSTSPQPSTPIFKLSSLPQNSSESILTLSDAAGTTFESRTQAVHAVMKQLRDSGYITGWRDENYPVAERFDEVSKPVFLIERAAASLLGILEYGVHVNGIVIQENSVKQREIKMWMARRSNTKSKFPGFLDHIVAGGQPAGLSLMENVIKECMEEAGIPPELTKQGIQPAGAISYEIYGGKLKNDGEGVMSRVVLFCFDLMLPSDFVPTANDGEIENFFKWGLEDIALSMDPEYDDPIKPNCYPGK